MISYVFSRDIALLYLNLRDTGVTDDNAECIGQALKSNSTLQVLNIDTNYSLGNKGGHFILESLLHSIAFRELRVSVLDGEIKEAFYIARQKIRLPSIDVFSSYSEADLKRRSSRHKT